MQPAGTEGSKRLPCLRRELQLMEGAPTVDGEPTWLIHDPLQNSYIQIDRSTYAVLSVWSDCSTQDELCAKVENLEQVDANAESIAGLVDFMTANKLIDLSDQGGWKSLMDEREQRDRMNGPLKWLAHNYLFFRIPIWRPQAFLERTLPLVRPLISHRTAMFVAVLGVIGLYLVSRQWDDFTTTFQYVFTWEGAIATALALAFVKVMHELGHAYTAAYFGCRVPTMGLAFIIMTPLLYTDVTDAWRLRDRRQRLAITGAGVTVELMLAAICLFVWSFLPEGPVRSAAFLLATASIIASLAFNLNPLMRFDGYYLLADWLGIENLQERAFTLTRWRLREWFFALGVPCPEQLSRRHVNILTVYAVCTWIYRLALFIAIALVVYHYFFKVLGIILFAIEIIYFVARPMWSELKVWWSLRRQIRRTRRSVVSALALASALIAAIVPWSTRVEVPAVLEPQSMARVFPTRPARIVTAHIKPGQHVTVGDPLFTLDTPDIDKELELAQTKLRLARMQHARRMADAVDMEASLELESTVLSLTSAIAGLNREKAELVVRAPIAGVVVEVSPNLHPNRWIGAKEMLAIIAGDGQWIARGYVAERDMWRIASGSAGTFIPESLQRPSTIVAVSEVGIGSSDNIEIEDLASTYGGRIAVNRDEKHRLVPVVAQYPVRMTLPDNTRTPELIERGVVAVHGKAESFAAHFLQKAVTVVLRESGF